LQFFWFTITINGDSNTKCQFVIINWLNQWNSWNINTINLETETRIMPFLEYIDIYFICTDNVFFYNGWTLFLCKVENKILCYTFHLAKSSSLVFILLVCSLLLQSNQEGTFILFRHFLNWCTWSIMLLFEILQNE
jgi:hypothetical protein